VPIKSFYDDKNDCELFYMGVILENLASVNDVREYIREIVDMNQVDYKRAEEIFKKKKREQEKIKNLLNPNKLVKRSSKEVNNSRDTNNSKENNNNFKISVDKGTPTSNTVTNFFNSKPKINKITTIEVNKISTSQTMTKLKTGYSTNMESKKSESIFSKSKNDKNANSKTNLNINININRSTPSLSKEKNIKRPYSVNQMKKVEKVEPMIKREKTVKNINPLQNSIKLTGLLSGNNTTRNTNRTQISLINKNIKPINFNYNTEKKLEEDLLLKDKTISARSSSYANKAKVDNKNKKEGKLYKYFILIIII
jgi:hypothetical protein